MCGSKAFRNNYVYVVPNRLRRGAPEHARCAFIPEGDASPRIGRDQRLMRYVSEGNQDFRDTVDEASFDTVHRQGCNLLQQRNVFAGEAMPRRLVEDAQGADHKAVRGRQRGTSVKAHAHFANHRMITKPCVSAGVRYNQWCASIDYCKAERIGARKGSCIQTNLRLNPDIGLTNNAEEADRRL